MAARLEAPRAGVRPVTVTAPARRAGLAWPRLPAVAELATIGAGYRRRLPRVCPGAPGHPRGPPCRVRARGPAVAGRAAPAPEDRALAQRPRRGPAPRSPRRPGTTTGCCTFWSPRWCWPGCTGAGLRQYSQAGCARRWCWPRPPRTWCPGPGRPPRPGSRCPLAAAVAVARAAVRLRRRAAGRAARSAARRAGRCRRRRARRAHAHRHPARSSRSRGHRLPGGRILGCRCRRDRGRGHPRPPPQPRDWGEAPQQPAGCIDQGQDGVPALAALTEPARTARAAGQGPRPRGPASSPSAGRAGPGWAGPEAGRGKQPQPGAGSRRPRPQPAPHPAGARNQETPMAPTDPRSGEDNDTGYDYYDTPSGNIWRPGAEPGQPPGDKPGRRPGATGRAALLFPSLIVRTWHHRPGRGPVRPDKETP